MIRFSFISMILLVSLAILRKAIAIIWIIFEKWKFNKFLIGFLGVSYMRNRNRITNIKLELLKFIQRSCF